MSDKELSSDQQNNDALDDLDTFLDEFGKQSTEQETGAEAAKPKLPMLEVAEEVALAELDDVEDVMSPAEEDLPELSAGTAVGPDELNLDVAQVDEFEPEFEQMPHIEPGDLFANPAADPGLAQADEIKREGINIMAAEDEVSATTKRGMDISIGGLALFALLVAAGAVWYALSLQGQITELRSELAQPRQSAGFVSGPDLQTQEELGRLNQRLNEMANQLQGPVGSLSESNQRELADIFSRMDSFEKAMTDVREELVALQRSNKNAVVTTTNSKAAPSKSEAKAVAQESAPKASTPKAVVPKASTTGRTGNWVVNVASLTDAKAASAEQQRLKKEGIVVEVHEVVMSGRTWYRVRATGFASREEAQVYGDILREHVSGTPWVGQN